MFHQPQITWDMDRKKKKGEIISNRMILAYQLQILHTQTVPNKSQPYLFSSSIALP